MKRMKVLFGQRRVMVLVTLTILVLAAAALVASSASFTSTSANPSNVFTAGNLSHTNSKDGSAILTASLMKPGDTKTGTVIITNTGDIGGAFTLKQSSMSNGAGTPSFGSYLTLTIVDQTTGIQVYPTLPATAGPLNGIPVAGISLGNFASGAPHTFVFTVKFPDGGVDASGVGKDNQYMTATASCTFNWVNQ